MAQIPQDLAGEPESTPVGPVQNTRRARALVGWMTEEAALREMCSGRVDVEPTDEQRQRAAEARAAVAARGTIPDADEQVTEPAPPEVLAAFGPNRVQEIAQAGFEIRLVDLERVRAFQNHVLTEQAIERVAKVDGDDLPGLTQLTLPMPQPVHPPIQYDDSQRAWMVLWPDLNLQVVDKFQAPITDASGKTFPVLGFVIGAPPSLLRVTEYQGRHALTDGYHRAFGLLSRGINRVPALFHRVENFEDLRVPPGMLPQAQWLGPRPPRLGDYLDDAVADMVDVIAAQRLIVVQAVQSTPMG